MQDTRKPRRHRTRRPHPRTPEPRGGPGPSEYEELDDALLTDGERALRDARRTAEAKVEIAEQALKRALLVVPLLLFVFPVGVFLLFWWGIPLARRYYGEVLGPRLRERFVREEVQKRVDAHLLRERRQLQDSHARSMHELSASIAHEIRNPITAAKSLVQQMEEEPAAAENVEYARVALEELSRVERSVAHLLRYAREEEMRAGTVRLADVVDSALESFRDRLSRSGIALDRQVDAPGELHGDAEQLRRVVINLVGNAIDALEEAGTPRPRVEVHLGENLAGSEVWLSVSDNGPGIDESVRRRIWSPFATSKADGTGLGLSICRKVVDAHGGTIEVKSEPGAGAEFVLCLPKRPKRPSAESRS